MVSKLLRELAIALLLTSIALVSSAYATEKASNAGIAKLEARRDLDSCVKMENPVPCAVVKGFECERVQLGAGDEYACYRQRSRGFVMVQFRYSETSWRRYYEWIPKRMALQ